MATIINVTKNTFNRNQTKRYQLVKGLVASFIYRTYPSGTGGYEDFGASSYWLEALITREVAGDPRTEASIKLDPALMTEEHIRSVNEANSFASKWNVRAWEILDKIFLNESLPCDTEMEFCKKLSVASNKRHTSIDWMHCLNEVARNNEVGYAPTPLIREILTEFLEMSQHGYPC